MGRDYSKHPGHYADEIIKLPKEQWEAEIAKAPKSMQPTIKKCINREFLRYKRQKEIKR